MAENRSKIGQNGDGAKGTIHDPSIFGTRFWENQPYRLKFTRFLIMRWLKKSISVQGGRKKGRILWNRFIFFSKSIFFSFFVNSPYLRHFFLCFQNGFYLNNAHHRHQNVYQNGCLKFIGDYTKIKFYLREIPNDLSDGWMDQI